MIKILDDLKIKSWHRFLIKIRRFFRSFFYGTKKNSHKITLVQRFGYDFIIETKKDLIDILFYSRAKIEIIKEIQKEVFFFITIADDFIDLLYVFNADQRYSVFSLLKEQLPNIMKTNYDFVNILSFFKGEEKLSILKSLRKYLPNVIKTNYQFMNIFQRFDHKQKPIALMELKSYLPNVITTIKELAYILTRIDQKTVLFELKDNLSNIIKTRNSLSYILPFIQDEEVLKLMKQSLINFIKTPNDLNFLLYLRNYIQKMYILHVLGKDLRNILKNKQALTLILSSFCDSEKKDVLANLKEYFPDFIDRNGNIIKENKKGLFRAISQNENLFSKSKNPDLNKLSVPPVRKISSCSNFFDIDLVADQSLAKPIFFC